MQLPTITTRQQDIILYLYRFRFLNRIQIQALLNHKSPKNTNVWLKDLTDKKYIDRIFEKKAGVNDPAIYYLSKYGIKFLLSFEGVEKENVKKLYQEKRKSTQFIHQCILIANIYLKLKEQNLSEFKFYSQQDFPVKGVIRELQPSFAYVYEKEGKTHQFTCEIIKTGTPRFAIRGRIQKYIEFFKDQPDMNVIFICENLKISEYIDKYVLRITEEDELAINFNTALF